MNRMVQEYKLVESAEPSKLDKEVSELLSNGWQLYGPPAVSVCTAGASFIQAVVKEYEQPGALG